VPAVDAPADGAVPAVEPPAEGAVPAVELPAERLVPEVGCDAEADAGLLAGDETGAGVEDGLELGVVDCAKETTGIKTIVAIAINFVMFLFIMC
jgi:hypothetical protein